MQLTIPADGAKDAYVGRRDMAARARRVARPVRVNRDDRVDIGSPDCFFERVVHGVDVHHRVR